MNLKIVHKVTFFSLFLFCSGICYGQAGIKVNASVDKRSILIGERIRFILEADVPESQPIRFFSIDTIDHFEFINKGKIDTVNTSGGTKLSQQFLLTSFDSGQWVIPSYVLDAANKIQTDSFVIDVGFTTFDTSRPYNDIKDIIEVTVEEKKENYWYYIAAAGTVIVLLLIYFLTRKKKPKSVAATVANPFEEAMKQLEEIRKQGLSSKEYYTRLTDIFRTYLVKRKNISSMQKTTDELVEQMRALKLDTQLFDRLAQTLRLSDFVKFAKYEPSAEDNTRTFDIIKNSIQTIEKMPG